MWNREPLFDWLFSWLKMSVDMSCLIIMSQSKCFENRDTTYATRAPRKRKKEKKKKVGRAQGA